jgi:hypothetical protein
MTEVITLILRVVVLSTALACAIVYGAPLLAVPANATTATIGVFLPPVALALLLGWWQWQERS